MNSQPVDVLERWMAGDSLPGVAYALNDSVRITKGPHRGELGAVITLLQLSPDPVYHVELGSDGNTIQFSQSELERAA